MGAPVPKVLLKPSTNQGTSSPSILQQTVSAFADDERCERIVVCVPGEWRPEFSDHLGDFPKTVITDGGATRQESVLRGLEALESLAGVGSETVVLVHDAARCCVSQAVIDSVVSGVLEFGAVTAGVPVVDSLCRAQDGVIEGYVERANAWAVQTPQGFRLGELARAHREAVQGGYEALDDASLVARLRSVRVVPGDRFNIKVTQPEDLSVAELVSGRR